MQGLPVLGTGDNQMTGDTIHLINNTITQQLDTLKVFNNAFLIQKDSLGYNQVKGKRLIGLFTNNELDTINIDQNAQVIYFARNDNDELIGINNTVSSSIQMYMENQEIEGIRFIKKGTGKIYPLSKLHPKARTQSMDLKEVACEACSNELKKYGITVFSESRAD